MQITDKKIGLQEVKGLRFSASKLKKAGKELHKTLSTKRLKEIFGENEEFRK